jgi:hypothetical protein
MPSARIERHQHLARVIPDLKRGTPSLVRPDDPSLKGRGCLDQARKDAKLAVGR